MKKIFISVKNYFVGVVAEVKKITWPTREQVVSQTIIVIVGVSVLAIFFALIDYGFSELVKVIINWRQ